MILFCFLFLKERHGRGWGKERKAERERDRERKEGKRRGKNNPVTFLLLRRSCLLFRMVKHSRHYNQRHQIRLQPTPRPQPSIVSVLSCSLWGNGSHSRSITPKTAHSLQGDELQLGRPRLWLSTGFSPVYCGPWCPPRLCTLTALPLALGVCLHNHIFLKNTPKQSQQCFICFRIPLNCKKAGAS